MKFRDSASFHGFRFKSAIPRIPLVFRDRGKSLALPDLGSRSSSIRSTCPAHFNRLFTNLPIKHFCMPTSSLSSSILLRSTLFTPAIRLTQLSSYTCSLCWCFSNTGNVSRPYNIAGVTHAPNTFPFNFFEMCLSDMTPSTCLHLLQLAPFLLTSVSDRPSLLTAPPR